jgi:hypothetical protein
MKIELLQKTIDLIKEEQTGNALNFASKLNISERMVYKYISLIKIEFHAPVKYCRTRNTYYFTEKGNLILTWQNESENKL